MKLKRYPDLLGISVTDRCNHNCDFCLRNMYISNGVLDQLRDMSIDEAKIIADKIAGKIKIINLSAGYGESFLNKNIKEIVDIFSKKGIKVLMYSNGKILINQPTYLFNVKFNILVISINKNSYSDKLLDIIKNLPKTVKKKIIFSILIDYEKNDYTYLLKIANYSEKHQIKVEYHWQFRYTDKITMDKKTSQIYNYLRHKKYKYVALPNYEYSKKILCKDPFKSLYLTKDGYLRDCCVFYESNKMYNIFKCDLKDMWNNDFLNNIRKQFNRGNYPLKCKNCPIGFGNVYAKRGDIDE